MRMTVLAAAIGLALALAPAAHAGEAEQAAGRAVVSDQIEAFLAGDFERAYSHASPGIKSIFPTLDGFMAMVQRGYQPVFRPGNYAFGRVKEDGGRIVQEVLVSGKDGKDYTAIYTLEVQPDGSLKIAGVQIGPGQGGVI